MLSIIYRFRFLLAFLALFSCDQKPKTINSATLSSPDGSISIIFEVKEGKASYSINKGDKKVILPSAMGFDIKDATPIQQHLVILDTTKTTKKTSWERPWGESKTVEDHYHELTIQLKEDTLPNRKLDIIFRAYNDGIGFRYVFPEQENLKSFEIMEENTAFRLADDHKSWWIPGNFDSYEQLYRTTRLSEILATTEAPLPEGEEVGNPYGNQTGAVNTPITMQTNDGLFLSIHEANLTDYAGMTLKVDKDKPFTFTSGLVPWPDGVKVKAKTPFKSPWRTIQIAETAGDLITSNLIVNLNEPSRIEDTSWITPMKYAGIWWSMHIGKHSWGLAPAHGATTENAKAYIDFASDGGIPGLLIEGWNKGWESWGKEDAFTFTESYDDFDLEEVVNYGKEKGVSIIGHHETGGDVPSYEKQIDDAFALYKKVGINAIKTGYAGKIRPKGYYHHGQQMVRHYRMVVEKAAANQMMIDAHEPIKPTGIRRTWPNMMSREGVRGIEYNAWSIGNAPEHTTILPFTRMLAGPIDYTPGIFDITFDRYRKETRVHTTLAKQLALYVVIYSPLQMIADLPENYKGNPAFQFIRDLEVDWDATKVVNAAIGDYVTIARKSNEKWFLGSITDESPRTMSIPLSFLDSGKKYKIDLYADSNDTDLETNPTAVDITRYIVDASTTLNMKLASSGGAAAVITPASESDLQQIKPYE